ncbi:MAG: phage late control D family protein [Myxococcales bacterium]|nr:phage late control D family protein [Myxococcales bacterium]
MADVTEKLAVSARPRFEVDGRSEARLTVDLLELEATEDEDGIARLEARFLNWGGKTEGADPDFLYFDAQTLDLGRTIRVVAGEDDAEDVVFEGRITAVEGVFPEHRAPEVLVRAEDALMWMRMRHRTRTHEERSDADIAQAVVADNGERARADAPGPSHAQLWQVNQTELSFLRERARAVDARLACVDGQVVFVPRRGDARSPVRLSRHVSLIHFEVAADLAHQRKEVHVHGWSVSDKEGIHERAGDEAVASEAAGGRTGPGILGELGVEAVEHLHLEAPATRAEAESLAKSVARRRARRFVCGRGITDGTPALHIGRAVELLDLGPWFSGTYHLTSVTHTYDQRVGLRTRFVAERAGLGGR